MYAQHINNTWQELSGNIVFSSTVFQTAESLSDEQRAEFNIYLIVDEDKPVLGSRHKFGSPIYTLIDATTVARAYPVIDKTQAEIDDDTAHRLMQTKAQREAAYREESDPLFFKAQRGEATMDMWLLKVNEIKARYPDIQQA